MFLIVLIKGIALIVDMGGALNGEAILGRLKLGLEKGRSRTLV
jgi:hypothetical protein